MSTGRNFFNAIKNIDPYRQNSMEILKSTNSEENPLIGNVKYLSKYVIKYFNEWIRVKYLFIFYILFLFVT